eukprot:scaffold24666_cov62-Phaeocystis_antarctica.AAC.3
MPCNARAAGQKRPSCGADFFAGNHGTRADLKVIFGISRYTSKGVEFYFRRSNIKKRPHPAQQQHVRPLVRDPSSYIDPPYDASNV